MNHRVIILTINASFNGFEQTIYPTVLCDNKNIILVDCGYMGTLPLLEEELSKHNISLIQLTGIVLTHHDHDHMGTAAEIKRYNPNVKIYASKEEAPYIEASKKPLRLIQAEELQAKLPPNQQEFGKAFCAMLSRLEPVKVDEFLEDEENKDWCNGCTIIATPGHTPGHISLFIEDDSLIITGDAFALNNGLPVIANPEFTLDIKEATSSMQQLLDIEAKAYYCYHGGVYTINKI
jgi:glyoxylase-like metal-dependent hydrolase (beta-lactamase superfamily II)